MPLDLSADKPVNNVTSDANAIADAFTKIETNVNALPISQLAGYPSDATKFLKGDGTWGVVTPTVYRKTTAKTVNTTTAATDLLNGEITIAAGVMGSSGLLRVTLMGDWLQQSGSAVGPPRFQVVFGGTTIFDTGVSGTITSTAVRYGWRMQAEVMNLGAANAQVSSLHLTTTPVNGTATATLNALVTGEGFYQGIPVNAFTNAGILVAEGVNPSTAVDTSNAKTLVVNVINASASATYETKLYGAVMEVV